MTGIGSLSELVQLNRSFNWRHTPICILCMIVSRETCPHQHITDIIMTAQSYVNKHGSNIGSSRMHKLANRAVRGGALGCRSQYKNDSRNTKNVSTRAAPVTLETKVTVDKIMRRKILTYTFDTCKFVNSSYVFF